MEKVNRNIRDEALWLIKALSIHGCDLPKLKYEAIVLERHVSELAKPPQDLKDAVRIIFNKINRKEAARKRMTR